MALTEAGKRKCMVGVGRAQWGGGVLSYTLVPGRKAVVQTGSETMNGNIYQSVQGFECSDFEKNGRN